MKKYLLVILLSGLLLITGCGNKNEKKLVCNQKVLTVDVNMIADFNDNNLDYLGLKYTMDLSDYSDAQIQAINDEDMCTTVKETMNSNGLGDAFTNCKQKINDKVLEITADFDLDKMIGNDISRETSIEEAIKELEQQGYKCEVK